MKRVKRRYLALQLDCDVFPPERDLIDAVWAAVTKLYGEVGASLTNLTLISFDEEHKIFVVRTLLASLPMLRASLATITVVAGKAASVHVLAISGTLRALYANIG